MRLVVHAATHGGASGSAVIRLRSRATFAPRRATVPAVEAVAHGRGGEPPECSTVEAHPVPQGGSGGGRDLPSRFCITMPSQPEIDLTLNDRWICLID